MLVVKVPLAESYDEDLNEFVVTAYHEIELEHSLVSLSKWEQKYEKPFLSEDEKSMEETLDYIRLMADPVEIPDEVMSSMTESNFKAISDYINARMSATWFSDEKRSAPFRREVITSEIIYYWMLSLNIDMICETWHLNRLMTLIRVTNEKNAPQKKLSKAELAARNRALNERRRSELKTKG